MITSSNPLKDIYGLNLRQIMKGQGKEKRNFFIFLLFSATGKGGNNRGGLQFHLSI